jgi:DNA-binding IscR family transcriptional regulator
MPPRCHRRSNGVDTIDDVCRTISQQEATITREFGSLQNCIYLYNQWQSKAPQKKADNAKRGYLARQKLLDLQNKLNQRIREEDEEANRRNEALGNLSPQSIWADPIRLQLR